MHGNSGCTSCTSAAALTTFMSCAISKFSGAQRLPLAHQEGSRPPRAAPALAKAEVGEMAVPAWKSGSFPPVQARRKPLALAECHANGSAHPDAELGFLS